MQKYGIGNLKKMLQQVGSMGWLNKHCNIYGKDVVPTCEISCNPRFLVLLSTVTE
jgi:hypothetical protein